MKIFLCSDFFRKTTQCTFLEVYKIMSLELIQRQPT